MKRALLLNPPGGRLYIRDYYCSKVSQADYFPQPVDLVMLSGILSREHEIGLVDAIAERLSPGAALSAVSAARPDVIVSLVGSASLQEDLAFLARLKKILPAARLIASGDIFREEGRRHLKEHPFIEAALLDFTSDDILRYLRGDTASVENMIFRSGTDIVVRPAAAKPGTFSIPVPEHRLFLGRGYRYPFTRGPFLTTLTDYGCPFPCSFCVIGTLGFKVREVENIIEELRTVRSLGIREILFQTQTFGANREQANALCRRMIEENLGLGWVCFSRVDTAAPELLELMKKAGCHTVIFGVESGSDEILTAYRKGYDSRRIAETLTHCRKIGLETVGTFILGLPEETRDTMRRTLDLLRRIPLDFASFNVAVPRAGTPLRREALELRFIDREFNVMDQSGSEISMPTKSLSREEVLAYRRKAVFTFYFRLGYVIGRLRSIRSTDDLIRHLRQALGLVARTWFS